MPVHEDFQEEAWIRIGVEHVKMGYLSIIRRHPRLQACEIGRRVGTYTNSSGDNHKNWLTHHVLNSLVEEGLVGKTNESRPKYYIIEATSASLGSPLAAASRP